MRLKAMEEKIADAIRSLGKAGFYPAVASLLNSIIEYDNIIAMISHGRSPPQLLYKKHRGPDVFRRLKQDYLTAAYLLDPFAKLHINGAEAGTYKLLDIAPDNFSRSKYYQWYYGDLGITDEITLFCPLGFQITATISIGKGNFGSRYFGSRSEQRLKKFEPVLISLLEAHWSGALDLPSVKDEGPFRVEMLIKSMINQHGVKLSNRQAEVALLILQGHSSLSAAHYLDLSPQTIKVFRKQLYKKCQISSQAELFTLMMPLIQKLSGIQ